MFSQELKDNIYEPWSDEYVQYESILSDMQRRQQNHPWNEKDELDFKLVIGSEADRIEFFISRKQREIDSRLAYCERSLTQQNRDVSQNVSRHLYESTDDTLTEILMDLNDLSKFTRLNVVAIQNLVQTHDSTTPFNAHPLFVDIIRSKSLDRQRFDIALVKISTLHELCRNKGQMAQPSLEQKNELTTAKYWIHPDNVTELKAILLFHLPVVVYDPNKPMEAADSAISSVYLDNPDFDLYQGTLQRDSQAENIRVRWYGHLSQPHTFLEREIHRESEGVSVKERIEMPADRVNDFLQCKYTADHYANELRGLHSNDIIKDRHRIATSIQQSIQSKRLEPVMRIFHNRTTFQAQSQLRITLDSEVVFVREDGMMERRNGSWRRPDMDINYPFDHLKSTEIQRFPHALLETKCAGDNMPVWLSRLLESHLVYEVPRFSKYLQGVSYFWNPRLPMLPWWLSELNVDIRNHQSMSNFSGLSRSKSLKPLIDGKYRVGYLEAQLQKSSTLVRSESSRKKAELSRGPSTRSMVRPRVADNRASIQSNPFSSTANSPRSITPQTHRNPFDDPVWQNDNYDWDTPGGSKRALHNQTPDSKRFNEFHDTSSAEYLIGTKGDIPNDSNATKGVTLTDVETGEKKSNPNFRKIDPKIYFANERTFIHWLHFAALILTVAITLINFGDRINTIVGCVLFSISFILAIYGTVFYRWRGHRITHRPDERYDDIYGPVILVVLFVGGMMINFGMRFNAPYDVTSGHYMGIVSSATVVPTVTYVANTPSFSFAPQPTPTTDFLDMTSVAAVPTDIYDPATDIYDPATDIYDPATDIYDPATDIYDPATEIAGSVADSVPTGAIV